MTERGLTNLPASVRQRLFNIARASGKPFNELLQRYAMERFLYRLSRSPSGSRFTLKGALMFLVWQAPASRPTKDIDLLAKVRNDVETICDVMRIACRQQVQPDGITFDADSVEGRTIAEHAEYEGVRVRCRGRLDSARVSLQIDVGFGDAVFPSLETVRYPTLLDFPVPRLYGYTRESTIAEKFHTMITLSILNSRMKDFFDIWVLCRSFDFDGRTVAEAIRRTFANRKTEVPNRPSVFDSKFGEASNLATLWNAFVRKSRLEEVSVSFADTRAAIVAFLQPVANAIAQELPFVKTWRAPGPWK